MSVERPPMRGVCPVVAVPFTEDGEVDLASFVVLVEHLLAEDVGAVTLFGLASEFHKLGDDERRVLRTAFLEQTSAHPTVAGVVSVTDHSTELAVRWAREAAAAGADVLNVLPPHFLTPSGEDVVAHLDAVAAAVEIPVVVQYAPAQTGSSLEAAAIAALAERRPNVRFVKVEADPPGPWIDRLREASGGRVAALVGSAGVHMIEALDHGASGVQPGCSFVPIYAEIMRRYVGDDRRGAAELHARLLPFIADWMGSVERIVQVEKTILQLRGIIATEYCRRPGHALTGADRATIDDFVELFDEQFESQTA